VANFVTVEKLKKSSEERDELGNLLTDIDFSGECHFIYFLEL